MVDRSDIHARVHGHDVELQCNVYSGLLQYVVYIDGRLAGHVVRTTIVFGRRRWQSSLYKQKREDYFARTRQEWVDLPWVRTRREAIELFVDRYTNHVEERVR